MYHTSSINPSEFIIDVRIVRYIFFRPGDLTGVPRWSEKQQYSRIYLEIISGEKLGETSSRYGKQIPIIDDFISTEIKIDIMIDNH